VASARSARPAPISLYDLVAAALPGALAKRFGDMFEAHLISGGRGGRYHAGRVIRQAWEEEKEIPAEYAREIAELCEALLGGSSLEHLRLPDCCDHHIEHAKSASLYEKYPPADLELLEILRELSWIFLPHLRGLLRMSISTAPQRLRSSIFMPLDWFLRRHSLDSICRTRSLADSREEFIEHYKPDCPDRLRRARLSASVKAGELIGLVAAHSRPNPERPGDAPYCPQSRPFWTSTRELAEICRHTTPPEDVLKQLGMSFEAGETFVELVHIATVHPAPSIDVTQPTTPTIVDAQGDWLFRPDRSRKGPLLWNNCRDISTNGRGRQQLSLLAVPVAALHDLVVWSRPTGSDWVTVAAPSLMEELAT